MTCTLTDSPTSTAPRPPRLAALWRRLRRHHEAGIAGQRLAALDDHLLRDIGLDRADIAAAVRGR